MQLFCFLLICFFFENVKKKFTVGVGGGGGGGVGAGGGGGG